MRQILVEDARRRGRIKNGDGHPTVSLQHDPMMQDRDRQEISEVHEASEKLMALDTRKAQVVECRYFSGLSVDETAEVLGLAPRTVDSEWHFARAWLRRELTKGGGTA